jgi:hypothetical protein
MLRRKPLSHIVPRCLCIMQQLRTPAGNGIQDGLQPTRACDPPRVSHRKQCVISLFFLFLTECLRTTIQNPKALPRGPGEHAGIRTAPVRRRIPRHRPGPHQRIPIRALAGRHLHRVLCRLESLERRTQPKRQDAHRVLRRLYDTISPLFRAWLSQQTVYVPTRDARITGSLEDLIRHGLHAPRETLQQDKKLSTNNTSTGILGPRGVHEAAGAPVDC